MYKYSHHFCYYLRCAKYTAIFFVFSTKYLRQDKTRPECCGCLATLILRGMPDEHQVLPYICCRFHRGKLGWWCSLRDRSIVEVSFNVNVFKDYVMR